ncbi:MAG: hypothetical protein LBJ61_01300 [Deltaproteobacteria bacterium]|jgi:hypothetical protein|nr:hypothetical protein [Deltaproteobacteria bacterium]
MFLKDNDNIPRSVEIITEQLADLEDLITTSEDKNIDFPSRLFFNSLESHKQELLEELKAAKMLESKADIELTIEGAPVKEHSIPASMLSKFIEQVQKLRYATGEFARGSKSSRTRFTKKLLSENELLVTSFSPSSFCIHVKYANDHFSPHLLSNTKERAGEALFLSLFAGEDDSDDLDLTSMSTRLQDYYREFLNFVTDNNIIIGTRTRNHPFSVKITPDNARELKQLLYYNFSTLKVVEEEISVEGILMMGNLKKQSFMIQTESTTYSGQISESGIIGLKLIPLGTNVLAKLLATSPSEESDKTSYLLLSIDKSSS